MLTEVVGNKKDAEKNLFAVKKGDGMQRKRGGEKRNMSSAIGNVDGVLCAERQSALIVMVGVLVEDRGNLGAIAEQGWIENYGWPICVAWCEGEHCATCAPEETTWTGDETTEPASLLALGTRNSLCEEGALWESAVGHV